MTDQRETLSLTAFNVRGIHRKENEIRKLADQTHILGICETWMRPKETNQMKMLNEVASTIQEKPTTRGYGGVALMIHPLIRYTLITKAAERTHQYITIRTGDVHITILYMAPANAKETDRKIWEEVTSIAKGKAIIMGDINARHTDWDRKTNLRGARIKKWASEQGWKVTAPKEHTCTTRMGSSTPDLVLHRAIDITDITVPEGQWEQISDHRPIKMWIPKKYQLQNSVGKIAHRLRKNPTIQRKAQDIYKAELPKHIERINRCSSVHELEETYNSFKETILRPWKNARGRTPHRFKPFWNRTLDEKAKMRSKLYAKAKKTGREEDWAKHNSIDKEIKRGVKRIKAQRQKTLLNTIELGHPSQKMAIASKLIRKASVETKSTHTTPLPPHKFTEHMKTSEKDTYTPEHIPLEKIDSFERNIRMAITEGPAGKAEGKDELFVEAFKICPEHIAPILARYWEKCNKLQYMLQDWQTAILIPIFKKGDVLDPGNYRPIAILSHARKTIEKAIAKEIQSVYQFNNLQLGFQEHTGVETAIIRHIAQVDKMKISAILDLKGAYDSVPRKRLMDIVKQRLPKKLHGTIAMTLRPLKITTKDDKTNTTATITKGVPQGSPLSPTLFNIYMDSLPERLKKEMEEEVTTQLGKPWSASLFADDVKLQAESPKIMKKLLLAADDWANVNSMKWAPHKCTIVQPSHTQSGEPYQLANNEIKTAESATYLGVDASWTGIKPNHLQRRIILAEVRGKQITEQGITHKRISSTMMKTLLQTYVTPLAMYAIHLTPIDEKTKRMWQSLEAQIIQTTLGTFKERKRVRYREILGMLSLEEIIAIRLGGLENRIKSRAKHRKHDMEARMDITRLKDTRRKNNAPKNNSTKEIIRERKDKEKGKVTRLPESNKLAPPPTLGIPNLETRTKAVRWYSGEMMWNITRKNNTRDRHVQRMISSLTHQMTKKKLNKTEINEVTKALNKAQDAAQPSTSHNVSRTNNTVR